MSSVEAPDWSALPVPADDGATRHLAGMPLPAIALPATDGSLVDLSSLPGLAVVYAYPRTGQPGVDNPPGWDSIPGARGCTPQTCAFRDRFTTLQAAGVRQVFGLSTQDPGYQKEAAERLHLPFSLLSDEHLQLTRAMHLPTFEISSMRLLKRFTLLVETGVVAHVFYPVFPPDQNPTEVLDWLHRNR